MKKLKLSPAALKKAAHCLKLLSHPVRLQIIQILLERERSVGEISEQCQIRHNVASTHLKTLERCNFLESRRRGKRVFYVVMESHLKALLECLERKFS